MGRYANVNLANMAFMNESSLAEKKQNFSIVNIHIDKIILNERNKYSVQGIDELKFSILHNGLKQNLEVYDLKNGLYKLISGERRYTAIRALVDEGYSDFSLVPCLVTDFSLNKLPLSESSKEMFALITTNAEARDCDGHQKWIDFVFRFWHAECVSKLSKNAFSKAYISWCKRNSYQCRQGNIDEIHEFAKSCVTIMPKTDISKTLIQQAVLQLNSVCECLSALSSQMIQIAQRLPEYSLVHSLYGVGNILACQLIAEIGDVRRFPKKNSLVCFAGLEAPPNQSGTIDPKSNEVSNKGSPHLRKTLFQIMDCYIKTAPLDEPIYQFLDRKRSEGKHYYCYMTAGSAKFLRIYYAKVSQFLNSSV